MKLTKHRNLFTGDCGYLFGSPESGPYKARVLHDHVDLLAESGVDTYQIRISP